LASGKGKVLPLFPKSARRLCKQGHILKTEHDKASIFQQIFHVPFVEHLAAVAHFDFLFSALIKALTTSKMVLRVDDWSVISDIRDIYLCHCGVYKLKA